MIQGPPVPPPSTSTSPSVPPDPDSALVGPTLKIYRLLLTSKDSLTAREVQKSLRMSSPSLAVFHLEKLERMGLVKSDDGHYSVSRLYLKHYFRLRRFLIPRYVFHSMLATFFLAGWGVLYAMMYLSPRTGLLSASRTPAFAISVLLSYGVAVTAILMVLFWFETSRVAKNDKI
jgi:DNA-binding transcriptional ArsR family regulator